MNLKSLKIQVLFSNLASEQEPLTAKLTVPLSSGMMNLSDGVKVWRVWACEFGQKNENTKTMMIATVIPVRTGLR